MHTTMQTLGRIAVIGGLALVALVNVYLFHDTESLPAAQKAELYARIYAFALVIPLLSVLGVILHAFLKQNPDAHGEEKTHPNWSVLGGSLAFVAITLAVGLGDMKYAQELIFLGSFAVIVFLLWRLARELEPAAREVLVATALILFVYRAMPATGVGRHLVDDRRAEVRRVLPRQALAGRLCAHARRHVRLSALHGREERSPPSSCS